MNEKQAPSLTTGDGLSRLGSRQTSNREANPTKNGRGTKHSSTRANIFRSSKTNKTAGGSTNGKGGSFSHRSNKCNKLSYDETVKILNKRNSVGAKKEDEFTLHEYGEVAHEREDEVRREVKNEVEEAYNKSVGACKVSTFGDIRVEKKHDEALRFLSVNVNGLPSWKTQNTKADRLKFIANKYRLDGIGLQEVCINWSNFPCSYTVATMLRNNAEQIRSVEAHNKLESNRSGNKQRGGTSTILRDQLAAYVKKIGKDHTGLGRWSWYLLEGATGHYTLVVTAYAPCGKGNIKTTSSNLSTVAQQHQRYIQLHELKTNPKQMFRDDLISFLTHWRKTGTRIILMMDANEHTTEGCMSKMLAREELQMREAVATQTTGQKGPKTWFRGKDPIDGIWITDDLEVIRAGYLPFDANVGDHRPVMVDLTMGSVLGQHAKRIVLPDARRLNSKTVRVRDAYIERLEQLFDEHKVLTKLQAIAEVADHPMAKEAQDALEHLDVIMTDLMIAAEGKCRKFYTGEYEFSPQIKVWVDKCHAYKWLIRHKVGKPTNIGNMKRFAKRQDITDPMNKSLYELNAAYKECKAQAKTLMADAPWMRRVFLQSQLKDAIDENREDDARRLKEIIRCEAQRREWRGIQRVTKGRAVNSVTCCDLLLPDGTLKRCDTKQEVEAAIATTLSERFDMAESAPICSGPLFDLLGYSADTDTAVEILEGRFVPPEGTDGPTCMILTEIARIWACSEAGEVDIVITQEDFQHYWRRAKERTASSYSGLHFGHYMAAAHSDKLSHIHALKLSTITKSGSAPKRWARGLSVMLEKVAGLALVTKLRGILLMEADFNYHNKLIFGKRMMDRARELNLIPEEIFSEKGRTSEDAILQQVLMYDIARQLRRPLLVASVDATSCYDRIAHSVAALTLRAYKVRNSSVMGMLTPIQSMEFFLRTGFGESTTYFGGAEDKKQGACQGNGAAPPTWLAISTLLVANQRRNHGVVIKSPFAKTGVKQAGVLYVDDTNLWAGLGEDDDEYTTAAAGQEAIDEWGGGLIATGGDLNGDKCTYTIHYQVPDGKGGWKYPDNRQQSKEVEKEEDPMLEELEQMNISITVPQATADAALIKRLGTDDAVKNLGLFARPDGDNTPHFTQMKARIDEWTVQVKNGELKTRSVWTSYMHQMWAGLRYGLAASSAPLKQLCTGLGTADYKMLSVLGVAKSIQTEVRYIPPTFGGIGIRHLPVETTAATVNAFLQHYGEPSHMGQTIRASLHNMQVEMGVQGCPLKYKYDVWEGLVTDSWVKAFWEKISKYNIQIDMKYETTPPPKERDRCVMEVLVADGWRGKALASANRARKRQEVMWLSCLTNARGTRIEQHYLSDWTLSWEYQLGRHRSNIEFGKELPTNEDWETWDRAMRSITVGANLSFRNQLGKWINTSPRIWRAFLDEDKDEVWLKGDNSVEVYTNDGAVTRYKRQREEPLETAQGGKPISFAVNNDATIKILTSIGRGDSLTTTVEEEHEDFLAHLMSYGGEWMWEHLDLGSDITWLVQAIQNGTAVAVTDGSYSKDKAPHISGAGWVIRCRSTGKEVRGSFVEYSTSAGSYRGELLGTLAINIFMLAIEEYFGIKNDAKVFCDNKGAVYTFAKSSKRISAGVKHADIQRVKRTVEARLSRKLTHTHVYGHQDKYGSRRKLRLEAYLNCICDELAKSAVARALTEEAIERCPILPLEQASVYLNGEKQTTDVSHGLRHHVGRAQAAIWYAEKERGRLSPEEFEDVAWEDLRRFHKGKPMMYSLWYGKQCSGYCGTGKWLKRWDADADSSCPNCGVAEEDADHLNRCPDFGRSQLWKRQVAELEEWLRKQDTQYHLAKLIPAYLRGRGKILFTDLEQKVNLGGAMPRAIRIAAHRQDCIGWRHFTEGKISHSIREIQHYYLSLRPTTNLTIDSWMKGLITKLVSMTHSQWIYRNITKHHHTQGTIKLSERQQVVQEIEKQLEMGTTTLDSDCACLLEIPTEELYNWSTEQQQYWLHAIQAARESGDNALRVSKGQTTSWVQAVSMENGGSLKSHTPYGEVEVPNNYIGDQGHPTSEVQSEHWGSGRDAPRPSTRKRPNKKGAGDLGKPNHKTGGQKSRTLASAFAATGRERALVSEEARLVDNLGLLENPSVIGQERTRLDRLLKRPRIAERRVIVKGRDSISQSSFAVLGTANWLGDEIMNFTSKVVLQPTAERVHVYSSHFMSKLLGIPPTYPYESTGYNYQEVRRWANRIPHGSANITPGRRIDDLRELYVVINKTNSHWLYLKVLPQTKTIQLRDSLGLSADNGVYMPHMLRYLYDVWKEGHQTDHRGFTQWSREWECEDLSADTPRQENGSDCGVFTILNMYLDMQGIALERTTYTQQWLYNNHTRRRLAYILMKSSDVDAPEASIEAFWHTSNGTTRCSNRRGTKRKSRGNEIVAVGGVRVKQRLTYHLTEDGHARTLMNRKRSALSVAESNEDGGEERHLLPPPKKRKGDKGGT